MRRKKCTEYIDTICIRCGNVSLFQNTPTKRITMFSKTSAWCFKCSKVTTHYILNDFDIAYRKLKDLVMLNEDQKRVLNVIEGKENKNSSLIINNRKEKKW